MVYLSRIVGAVVLMVIFIAPAAFSQILNVDIDKLKPMDSAQTSEFVVDLNASIRLNNRSAGEFNPVDFFGYNAGGDIGLISKTYSIMLMNRFDYLRINENTFLSTGYSHLRFVFDRESTVNYEIFSQYQYDNFRGLQPRLLAGSGILLTPVDTDNIRIRVGLGAMYEHEEWEHPYEEMRVVMRLLKSSNYLMTRWKINDYVFINQVTYFQIGYDSSIEAPRSRVSGDINLTVRLSENLRLFTRFSGAYEDKPIVPITRFIYDLHNGISVLF